ncbi:unnamed protein product [Vicia faba]|uniref:Uncharacterized protein n=1 Tax=Vicia faba TaxID=3906 RepID=A0AAV0ZX83_VICFA|nr:unnamed protein product [Vicia faba]
MSSFRVNPLATSLAFYLSILPFDSLLVLSIYTLRALGLAHFLSLGFRNPVIDSAAIESKPIESATAGTELGSDLSSSGSALVANERLSGEELTFFLADSISPESALGSKPAAKSLFYDTLESGRGKKAYRREQSLLIHLFANLLVGYPHSVTRIGLWSSYHPAVHHKSGRRRLN